VLIVEDDPGLRSVLERGLQRAGYVIDAVEDGERALRFIESYRYEAVVLDWRMPGLSGLDVVREVRRRGLRIPILMLTAKDTTADRVQGLDAGADDYLVKPFEFAELLARVRALQRRPPMSLDPHLEVGDLEFDPAVRRLTRHGDELFLTGSELAILELLMRRYPAVVDRRSIALQVWDDEADAVGSNTIDVHLARLRTKIVGGTARIETVRGIGYKLVSD
jgi:DNA-binding response OmpR family regulator